MHVVLDANTAASRDVNARLDRDHGILGQRLRARAREPRRFMHLESQAVARRMAEGRAKTAEKAEALRDF